MNLSYCTVTKLPWHTILDARWRHLKITLLQMVYDIKIVMQSKKNIPSLEILQKKTRKVEFTSQPIIQEFNIFQAHSQMNLRRYMKPN